MPVPHVCRADSVVHKFSDDTIGSRIGPLGEKLFGTLVLADPQNLQKKRNSDQPLQLKKRSKTIKTTYFFLGFKPFVNGYDRGSSAVLEGNNSFFDLGNGGHDSSCNDEKKKF